MKIDFGKLKTGEWVEGCCLVSSIDKEDVSANGNKYVTLYLCGDNNSDTKVNVFVAKEELNIPIPSVIQSKFTKKHTDKGDYVNMSQNMTVSTEYAPDEFIKCAPEEPDSCFEYITKILKANNYESENITLYDLTLTMLDKFKNKLLYYPASQMTHHKEKGGLIYHMKKMTKIAYDLASDYKVDKEVVICATILCVINKIYTLDVDEHFNAKVNKFYYMENPGELSLKICEKTMNKMEIETGKRFDDIRKVNFSICIRSYRGTRRQGASVTNLTKESCLVATIHELDVDMYVYSERKSETDFYELSDYDNRIFTQVLNI